MKKLLKNFISLFSGTALSQIIPFLATPILTRLFIPELFAEYAVYIAIVTILFVFSTARYELAIINSENENELENLTVLPIILTLIFSLIVSILFFFFGEKIWNQLNFEFMINYQYLIPVSLVIMSIYQSIYFYLNKTSNYKIMALNMIFQSISIALSNILIGFNAPNSGLIIGYVVGQTISILIIVIIFRSKVKKKISTFSIDNQVDVLKKFINFPKFLIVSNLANRLSLQSTILLFTNFYSNSDVGNYSVTHRILKTPLGFVGNTISHIFRQRMVELIQDKKDILKLYFGTFFILLLMGLVPFTIILFLGEEIFIFVLGQEWSQAGYYATLLVPMLYAQFCIAPLSSLFLITNKQKWDLYWQVFFLIISILTIIMTKVYFDDIVDTILYFSIAGLFCYIINFFMTLSIVLKYKKEGSSNREEGN